MPKVLIAEDDPTMLTLLKTLLEMEGFEVVILTIDEDVPDAVLREKPGVLLLDVHLGKQSGMEIVASMRKNPELSQVRVVMTSGLNVRDECLKRGADHFLLKPFMPDDLINVLRK